MEDEPVTDPKTIHRCRTSPMPGDFWNEMMMPQLLVLATNARGVLVITDTINKPDGWMWDFDKAKTISLEQMNHETQYCYCYPRFHERAVHWWKEHLGIAEPVLASAASST